MLWCLIFHSAELQNYVPALHGIMFGSFNFNIKHHNIICFLNLTLITLHKIVPILIVSVLLDQSSASLEIRRIRVSVDADGVAGLAYLITLQRCKHKPLLVVFCINTFPLHLCPLSIHWDRVKSATRATDIARAFYDVGTASLSADSP